MIYGQAVTIDLPVGIPAIADLTLLLAKDGADFHAPAGTVIEKSSYGGIYVWSASASDMSFNDAVLSCTSASLTLPVLFELSTVNLSGISDIESSLSDIQAAITAMRSILNALNTPRQITSAQYLANPLNADREAVCASWTTQRFTINGLVTSEGDVYRYVVRNAQRTGDAFINMIVTPDENNAQSITVAFLTPQESGVYSHGIEKMTATGNQIPIIAGTLTLNDDVVQPSDWSS